MRSNLGLLLMERELPQGVLEELNCPNCNGGKVALIFWGYPQLDQDLQKAIDEKKVVLGGCLISDNDPKWKCVSCSHRWGERDDY